MKKFILPLLLVLTLGGSAQERAITRNGTIAANDSLDTWAKITNQAFTDIRDSHHLSDTLDVKRVFIRFQDSSDCLWVPLYRDAYTDSTYSRAALDASDGAYQEFEIPCNGIRLINGNGLSARTYKLILITEDH